MRGSILLAVLLLVPLSGCVGPFEPGPRLTLFALPSIVRGDPTPVAAEDCDDLLATLNERALTQARVNLEQSVEGQGYGYWMGDGAFALGGMDASPRMTTTFTEAGSAAHAQVTGTNNQEAAADEADILKTDGEWTYVISGGALRILHSTDVGDVEDFARMDLGGVYGGTLLLEARDPGVASDDRLVLILPTYGGAEPTMRVDKATSSLMQSSMTRILVLSLEDRSKPATISETWIEGNPAGARLVDGHAHVIVQSYERSLGLRTWAHPEEDELRAFGLDWDDYWAMDLENQTSLRSRIALAADRANQATVADLELDDHLPLVITAKAMPAPLTGSVGARELPSEEVCQRVLSTPESTGRAFTTIFSLSVAPDEIETATTQVAAASSIVYASGDALVLAASSQDNWWFWAQPELEEATDLHWFDLDGLDVTLRASGRVAGIVQDSFGIDVHGDELRVATTTGTWGRGWLPEPEPMLNHVAVFQDLAGQLVLKGMVGGIAPGERIWSARFTDDRAYIVTFRNMDPLWVIDLAGPVPVVLGELEIPGVSTYIHPLDDDTLLAIGYGAPKGSIEGLDWSRIQVSLFDVSDPSNPRRADLLDLAPPNGWSSSGATQEHKAFTYWPAIGTLAVPLSTHTEQRYMRGGQMEYRYTGHVGLQLIDVDAVAQTLTVRGEVDQDGLLGAEQWGTEIQRSYFLGFPETGEVSVYAMSDLGVTAHDWNTLRLQGSVGFQGQ